MHNCLPLDFGHIVGLISLYNSVTKKSAFHCDLLCFVPIWFYTKKVCWFYNYSSSMQKSSTHVYIFIRCNIPLFYSTSKMILMKIASQESTWTLNINCLFRMTHVSKSSRLSLETTNQRMMLKRYFQASKKTNYF